MADEYPKDTRPGSKIRHGMIPLLRQSVYERCTGYEDLNDAERLRVDPKMRYVEQDWHNARELRGSISRLGSEDRDARQLTYHAPTNSTGNARGRQYWQVFLTTDKVSLSERTPNVKWDQCATACQAQCGGDHRGGSSP